MATVTPIRKISPEDNARMEHELAAFLREQEQAGADTDGQVALGYPPIPETDTPPVVSLAERAEAAERSGRLLIAHMTPSERRWTPKQERYYDQGYITSGEATERSVGRAA